MFGEDFLRQYKDFIESEYNSYLRLSLSDKENIIEKLHAKGVELQQVEGVPGAFKIISGADIAGKTIEFILGKYYIQSLSSMIPALVLSPSEHDTTLDLCAAPGSKTTQLASLMNNRGTLYANEVSVDRVKSLVFNIDKMNLVNLGVIKYKGELLSTIFENRFDKILVDAPCSALGIVQKKGEVSNWWNLKQAEKIAELQLRLLISAIKMLKVGGEIVYSTCTLTMEENELVINKALKNYPVELMDIELPVKSIPGFTKFGDNQLNTDLQKTRRIIPWEIQSEGFFICKLTKTGETGATRKGSFPPRNIKLLSHSNQNIKKYLNDIHRHFEIPFDILNDYKYIMKGNDLYFVNSDWETNNPDAFLRIGIHFGIVDKRGNAHLHTHAAQHFSNVISKNTLELENLDELDVYFNGGTIKRSFEPFGQKLVIYDGLALGTAIATSDGIKSQFPRAFRTQEIILK